MATRRGVLAAGIAAAGTGARHAASQPAAGGAAWDAGQVAHLLPTVSHDRMLIKASFRAPLATAPVLSVAGQRVEGVRADTAGLFWTFHVAGLRPGAPHRLELTGDGGALCEPWTLATFPAPEERPGRLRLLVFSCAGGHDVFAEAHGRLRFLPAAVRQRLLRRGLSFEPDALIANGDHVYWDLLAPRAAPHLGAFPAAVRHAGRFDHGAPMLGTPNEGVLLRAAGPQIAPLYGTLCRSVPVFFVQDDHDYLDNDEASDEAVTFPPDAFMAQAARATQHLYYPEFLP
ncbi:MAG: hypothetical protein ICV73_30585, partial [Acetobacteraceae bacterium]|nr:hypothetical protein [Acetobacteraceae bacterium]